MYKQKIPRHKKNDNNLSKKYNNNNNTKNSTVIFSNNLNLENKNRDFKNNNQELIPFTGQLPRWVKIDETKNNSVTKEFKEILYFNNDAIDKVIDERHIKSVEKASTHLNNAEKEKIFNISKNESDILQFLTKSINDTLNKEGDLFSASIVFFASKFFHFLVKSCIKNGTLNKVRGCFAQFLSDFMYSKLMDYVDQFNTVFKEIKLTEQQWAGVVDSYKKFENLFSEIKDSKSQSIRIKREKFTDCVSSLIEFIKKLSLLVQDTNWPEELSKKAINFKVTLDTLLHELPQFIKRFRYLKEMKNEILEVILKKYYLAIPVDESYDHFEIILNGLRSFDWNERNSADLWLFKQFLECFQYKFERFYAEIIKKSDGKSSVADEKRKDLIHWLTQGVIPFLSMESVILFLEAEVSVNEEKNMMIHLLAGKGLLPDIFKAVFKRYKKLNSSDFQFSRIRDLFLYKDDSGVSSIEYMARREKRIARFLEFSFQEKVSWEDMATLFTDKELKNLVIKMWLASEPHYDGKYTQLNNVLKVLAFYVRDPVRILLPFCVAIKDDYKILDQFLNISLELLRKLEINVNGELIKIKIDKEVVQNLREALKDTQDIKAISLEIENKKDKKKEEVYYTKNSFDSLSIEEVENEN